MKKFEMTSGWLWSWQMSVQGREVWLKSNLYCFPFFSPHKKIFANLLEPFFSPPYRRGLWGSLSGIVAKQPPLTWLTVRKVVAWMRNLRKNSHWARLLPQVCLPPPIFSYFEVFLFENILLRFLWEQQSYQPKLYHWSNTVFKISPHSDSSKYLKILLIEWSDFLRAE